MSNMYLGEKIETIIHARSDLDIGQYRGCSAKTFGAAFIDGVVYKVQRNVEVTSNWFWKVLNVNTGNSVTLRDQYDPPLLKEV